MIELNTLIHKRSALSSSHYSLNSSSCHSDYYCPVLEACMNCDKKSLTELLENGEDPNEPDSKGRTALHWAATRGRDDMIQLLIENGADICQTDHNGNTALHYCGHIDTIRCLVDFGADTRARNRLGDKPVALMRRRGVDPAALALLEQLEQEEEFSDESRQPLLSQSVPKRVRFTRLRDTFSMRNIWYEFCTDIGAERLVIVLLAVLILSLYVAYLATQLAKRIDTRIPVEGDQRNIEL